MSSALAFPATRARALGGSALGSRPLGARSKRPVIASSCPALRAARAATDAVVDKAAHNEEQAALRDEMVSGCTECTMPFEAERASALANAALADHSRASAIARDADESDDGTSKMSLRALVVGAETGSTLTPPTPWDPPSGRPPDPHGTPSGWRRWFSTGNYEVRQRSSGSA